ncbi:MAG: pyruvate, phosphate dikinase [archaeon]|nr:pyruvate, phosphate dikinase [archaeon]MDD2478022.1 pyruvate, phosphate dikinase [Candidatus ainarchaeum sp.]MDD3084791.1 pyruvate, phosphate dikinase [Candidatus ainarchaeum sp.]MDD4221351.1 pyruvate, phosphate dikinase [Candidatus ainarchaeum sp.]MDD4662646.1 pyruvate, phosphate dikinase [Candidatus ainarchaeum sp.]
MPKKYVYFYTEANKDLKHLLGSKGANLGEMKKLNIPVSPAFTITTQACSYFLENNFTCSKDLEKQILNNLKKIEKETNSFFANSSNPLLLSVRSGATVSMPGMMDTILNLGLNDKTVIGLSKKAENQRFAYDSYRRFIQMFGEVVLGVSSRTFKKVIDNLKSKKKIEEDTELKLEDLKEIITTYKKIIKKETKKDFPQDPTIQLKLAINSIFKSWNNKRAIEYRLQNNIENKLLTAVNVQAMVFGNLNSDSGTGVCFSRNPATGENKFYGEYLINAQGEDIVSGVRTPQPISILKRKMKDQYLQLLKISKTLEKHFKDMQDIEFTIENKKLFILQTRNGKRTPKAAVKIAMDMLDEKLITQKEAILRIDPESLEKLLHKSLDPKSLNNSLILTKGLPASPGAVTGQIVFSAKRAYEENKKGKKVILIRTETSPEDIKGINACQGILTKRGGLTSHAAVVTRAMGKVCVSSVSDLQILENLKKVIIKNKTFKEGDNLTIDGTTGNVYAGKIPLVNPILSKDFEKLMDLLDKYKKLEIRVNADNLKEAEIGLTFSVEGIGLCRTEHMFFEENKIKSVREMVLSESLEGRQKALDELLPMQRKDFVKLFKVMKNKPTTIRLLDFPLHELLPKNKKDIVDLAKTLKISALKINEKIKNLKETNPMLGFRGCRLLVTYPEITIMQTRAIVEAAIFVNKKFKLKTVPEIVVPLVGDVKEVELLKKMIIETINQIFLEKKTTIKYKIGAMIEIPRAALISEKLAKHVDFFSFGTNDLTQMTLGLSRDDSNMFLKDYIRLGVYKKDPFTSIDKEGVGQLMQLGIKKAINKNKNLKLGVCGEHAADPESILFFHKIGIDYVSCSPYRVPVARLSAARAAILEMD